MRSVLTYDSRALALASARSNQPAMRHVSVPNRRGAAAVEFAIVGPLLFTLVLGSIEFGRALMSLELLNNAARTGCRRGVLSGSSTTDIKSAVNTALNNSAIPSQNVTVTVLVNGVNVDASTAVRGDILTVNTSVPYDTISWLPSSLFLGGKTLTGSVVMRRE